MTIKNGLYAIAVLALSTGGAMAEGDAQKGAKIFKKCQSCHAVGAGAKNKSGPVLNGVVGRPAATGAGFKYSAGMKTKAAAGLVWTPDTLDAFLTKPRDFVKGTRMSFAGLRKADQRADLIAYLANQ